MSKCVGLITARGGSKGIHQKNIRNLVGKPLIAWTIGVAQSSHSLDRVIVSTEDHTIAGIARNFGAETPFLRPVELSKDNSSSMDVILHALNWLAVHEDYCPEYVMLLQPTSPLLSPEDIQNALLVIQDKHADSVVSVVEVHQHPYWMKRISSEGRLIDFLSVEHNYTRRQELPMAYALNGAIYLARRDFLLERSSFYSDNTVAYVMPPERSLDIDTPWDFHLAELILKDNLQHELD